MPEIQNKIGTEAPRDMDFAEARVDRRSFLAISSALLAGASLNLEESSALHAAEKSSSIISPETIRDCLKSNVRIRSSTGISGGISAGTLVNLPAEARILLREGEIAVLTCMHSSASYNHNSEIKIDVFEGYDYKSRSFPDKFSSYDARLVGQLNKFDHRNPDISILAFRPPRAEIERERILIRNIAPATVKYERGQDVLLIGCPLRESKVLGQTQVEQLNVPEWNVTKIAQMDSKDQVVPELNTIGARVYGHSGGGAFLKDGSVLGVCSGGASEPLEKKYIHGEIVKAYEQTGGKIDHLTERDMERLWNGAPAWAKEPYRGTFTSPAGIHRYIDALVERQKQIFATIKKEFEKPYYAGLSKEQAVDKLRRGFANLAQMIPNPEKATADFNISLELFQLHSSDGQFVSK